FFINLLTSKSGKKNIFNIIVTLAVMLLFIAGSSQINKIFNYILKHSNPILSTFKAFYAPVGFSVDAIKTGSIFSLFWFIVISVLPFAVLVYVLSLFYQQSVTIAGSVKKSKGGKLINSQSGILSALVRKEMSRYFSSYIYVLNTAISPLMLLFVSIASIFTGKEVLDSFTTNPALLQHIPEFLIAVFTVMLSITATTSSSISIEGKNFWILKSSPLKPTNIFAAKILLHLIIFIPITFISIIIMAYNLKISGFVLLFVFLIPLLNIISSSIMGLIINLLFPKMEWLSEVTVIKQSMSVIVSMAVNTLLVAIPIVAYTLLRPADFMVFASFVCCYLLLLIFGGIYYLSKKGTLLFQNI
ncbi:MAG: hypothetical protein BGN88_10730, partial [Clostridiales bacterium 43-6]